ncbi:sodium channel protein Nach-like [Leguminivora glycinivorella]|uniref:sodium channel protein Nach-like n=1 Tax=Leguminivora glycinivorella TaxID=1035111 RepID=UPI00201064F7|nr:sodium channel protein Nach-like [Leguminivora glycinivorella]
MRTVDPILWSKKVQRRKLDLSRPLRFGSQWGFEARVRGSFRDAMEEFWRNCSVGGVKRIVNEDTTQSERYRWMLLATICLVAGLVTLSLNLRQLVMEPPLVISLQSAQHSIQDLAFPAVALCSFNVVSRRKLNMFAQKVSQIDRNRTYSAATIRRNLLDSGALLTLALPKIDLQFMHYVSQVAPGGLNISLLMLELAPSCEDVLLKCSWAGRQTPCERLFARRITSVGVCCVFNGRYENVDRQTPPKILKKVGSENGLSVAIREDVDDFAYVRKPSSGTEMLIFDGAEYPFLEGGSVRVQLAPRETSTYYTINVRAQVVSPEIVYFTEAWRGCRISKPSHTRDSRSYSWCLLECRRDAALQLCGCVPFFLQPRKELVCTLNELSCLNKHREKFIYYHPMGYSLEETAGEALSEELQDALFCSDCCADCARPVYHVTASYAPYHGRHKSVFLDKFTHGLTLINTSVVHFFYSSEDQHLYSVMSNTDWFETIG